MPTVSIRSFKRRAKSSAIKALSIDPSGNAADFSSSSFHLSLNEDREHANDLVVSLRVEGSGNAALVALLSGTISTGADSAASLLLFRRGSSDSGGGPEGGRCCE